MLKIIESIKYISIQILLIWGGPIFSVSNGGDDDHGMNTAENHG
jgi:hypothetical protein